MGALYDALGAPIYWAIAALLWCLVWDMVTA